MLTARRVLAIGILGAYAALHATGACVAAGSMRWCFAFYSIACAVGAVALARKTFWARRFAMGIALTGIFNCVTYFAYWRDTAGYAFGVLQLAAFALLFVALLGKKMRATYDDLAPHWKFDHWTMHVLAAALSLNVAGIGMLVYYACDHESVGSESLRASAFCLAAVLSVGSILSARGRIAGLLTMTAAGGAAIWLGWSALSGTVACSWQQFEAVKSITGFAPAALGSIACFAVFLGPMVRFVRNKSA